MLPKKDILGEITYSEKKVITNISCCSQQLQVPNFGTFCHSSWVSGGLLSAAERMAVAEMGGQATVCVDFPIVGNICYRVSRLLDPMNLVRATRIHTHHTYLLCLYCPW